MTVFIPHHPQLGFCGAWRVYLQTVEARGRMEFLVTTNPEGNWLLLRNVPPQVLGVVQARLEHGWPIELLLKENWNSTTETTEWRGKEVKVKIYTYKS